MRYPPAVVYRCIHDLFFFIFVVQNHNVVSAVKLVDMMVAFGTAARVAKGRLVLFNLCKEIWRYMDDVACCCCVVRGDERMRERRYMFSRLF